jgi:hypothetical protein
LFGRMDHHQMGIGHFTSVRHCGDTCGSSSVVGVHRINNNQPGGI